MPLRKTSLALAASIATILAPRAEAGFHIMQVEEVIGGVNGNTAAQAIQLRLRTGGQNGVAASSLWAADATGSNRVLVLNIAANVSSGNLGDRVLLSTSTFNTLMGGTYAPDFTLTTPIPASYLPAGRLTFEDDAGSVAAPGTIYWSLAWGGAGYTGSHTGSTTNDADGNFGPAFASALPTSSRQGVLFTGAASALSTQNSGDYALSAIPATVTRNDGTAFTVVPEPGTVALVACGALLLGGSVMSRRRRQ